MYWIKLWHFHVSCQTETAQKFWVRMVSNHMSFSFRPRCFLVGRTLIYIYLKSVVQFILKKKAPTWLWAWFSIFLQKYTSPYKCLYLLLTSMMTQVVSKADWGRSSIEKMMIMIEVACRYIFRKFASSVIVNTINFCLLFWLHIILDYLVIRLIMIIDYTDL